MRKKVSAMRYSRLAMLVGIACLSGNASARTWTFDGSALGQGVDTSLFNNGGQLPGTYSVDILLNGEQVDTRDVVFSAGKNANGEPTLEPCLTVEQLSRYGIRVDDYPGLSGRQKTGEDTADTCAVLSAIPQATATFDFYGQKLQLSVPQVALRPKLKGIAPQEMWDDGVPALLLNYSANTSHTEYRNGGGGNSDDTYVQLSPGANLGAWRLRNQTNWQKSSDRTGKWQTVQTYAERGLYDSKSRITVGERFTPSDIFDSVPFRGAMLGSDDNMVPYNQREFAPVVRGIARTQARVVVTQNGYTVYNATVAPGPFALTDLSVPNTGGDLKVTVSETDGQTQIFTVPYQTPAIALREGYMTYNMMVGQYRPSSGGVDKALVSQATVMYGLPWNLTVYGGFQGAEHYQATSLGGGVSLGDWGSLSLDMTESRGQRRNRDTEQGGSWRLRYSKIIDSTNTTFTLASYRYASSGYNTLSDVLDSYRTGGGPDDWWYYDDNEKRKSNTSLTVNQSLGAWGYFNLSGSRQDYWSRSGHEDQFGAGYGVTLRDISFSLNWSQNKQINNQGEHATDRITMLSVNVPLDRLLGGSTYATYQMTSPSTGPDTNELGLSGQAFDRQLNWNVRQSESSGGDGGDSHASSLDLNWYGRYGEVGGNYRYSPSMRQMGGSVAGGIVAHGEGVTFGQPLNDTMVLVEAPGASGVSVDGWPGIKTDFRGYTIGAGVTPYQENTVSLDPTGLPADADITQTDVRVVPTQGAVIAAKFATRVGGRAMMTLTRPGGEVVPFGALATLATQGVGAGVVGENSQVYLTGLPENGQLNVKWGDGQRCQVSYHLPEKKGTAGVYTMKEMCR